MASNQPSRLHRARPWLAEKQLRKDPEARYKAEIRKRQLGLASVVVIGPLSYVAVPSLFLLVPGMCLHVGTNAYQWRQLVTTPEHFHEKDAATRALLADFRSQMMAGTWQGAKYRPAWMFTSPLIAFFIGLQFPALLHTSVLLGVAIGVVALVVLVGVQLLKMRKQLAARRDAMAAGALPTS